MQTALSMLCSLWILAFALAPADSAAGEHEHSGSSPAATELRLSPGVAKILRQEMRAIEAGMKGLIPAIASGKWEEVAATGREIRDSFIMKQRLSPRQRHELHRTLPPRFREMDGAFHHTAGMLAHAAEAGNGEVVTFYLQRLMEGCVGCHTRYATQRFPALATPPAGEHHH